MTHALQARRPHATHTLRTLNVIHYTATLHNQWAEKAVAVWAMVARTGGRGPRPAGRVSAPGKERARRSEGRVAAVGGVGCRAASAVGQSGVGPDRGRHRRWRPTRLDMAFLRLLPIFGGDFAPPLAQEKGRTRKRAHIHGHANATSNDTFLGPHIP
jgi:hypothetical protein